MTPVTVFFLMAIISGSPTHVGTYNNFGACNRAALDYTQASCVPHKDTESVFGTCWQCMHGCSRQDNLAFCGVDPIR